MPTQQKKFVSKRNPCELKRKDQRDQGYVWFATYDPFNIMEDNLRKVLSTFPQGESHFPKEIASIHVKDYDLMFGRGVHEKEKVLPFLAYRESSVAFIKLYLVSFTQFERLVCSTTGCMPFLLPDEINKGNLQITHTIFIDQSFPLSFTDPANQHAVYNSVAKIGTLEHLDILCYTHTQ